MTEEEIRLKKVEMRNLKNKKKRLPKVYHHRDFYRYYKDNCEGDVYPRLTYVN
jgi:hypothetical protein